MVVPGEVRGVGIVAVVRVGVVVVAMVVVRISGDHGSGVDREWRCQS